MQHMWIEDGIYAGVQYFSEVSVREVKVIENEDQLAELSSNWRIVVFPHKISLPLNHWEYEPGFPCMVARDVEFVES